MKSIEAIFLKQLRDTLKNKACLIQFVMFPVMVIIMEKAVHVQGMEEHFFVKLFSVMFSSMTPIVCMSSMIAEEKEKGTLKALMMSGVRPYHYLCATGSYVFMMCMPGTAVFAAAGEYKGTQLLQFVLIMSSGIILSMITGAVIGLISRDQMTATSLYVPVMMIFSFLPMLSSFNETIRKYSAPAYSQQISTMIRSIGASCISAKSVLILLTDLILAVVLFCMAYRRQTRL